jgi:hypothetical protein
MFPFAPLYVPVGGNVPVTPSTAPGGAFWYDSSNTLLDVTNTFVTTLIDRLGIVGNAVSPSPGQNGAIHFGDPDYGGAPSITWSSITDTQYDSPVFAVGVYTVYQVFLMGTPLGSFPYAYSFSAGDYCYDGIGYSIFTPPRPGSGGLFDAKDATTHWLESATPIVLTRRFDGTAAGDRAWINGVEVSLSTSVGDDAGTSQFNTWFTVLNYFAGGAAVDGSWVTTAFYTEPHSDSVRAQLEAYFTAAYSL